MKLESYSMLPIKIGKLISEILPKIIQKIEKQTEDLCNPNNGFILWKSAPEDLKNFSFKAIVKDLECKSPFLLEIFKTVTKNNTPALCAGLSIALRGRAPQMSAFAYYINSILQYGGAKKSVFSRLCKMAITTHYTNAVGKQREIAKLCGESLQTLKVCNEIYLKNHVDRQTLSLDTLSRSMEDLSVTDYDVQTITDMPLSQLTDTEFADVTNICQTSISLQTTPPATYSIIMDNLDFCVKAHNQSSVHTNKSIHWVHHVAVEDRISLYQLSNERPVVNLNEYDINRSLPDQQTQSHIHREFTVKGSRILTQYLDVFKPLAKSVVNHIPHQYSFETAQRSNDYPLGLIFKNENITAELVDVIKHIQKEYVPRGPDGISCILVGGDRLTEGNSRNVQWSFGDGVTREERLEGLVFKFEDWHALRNLLQIHHKIFFKKESSKDHGTLFSNMNVLRCTTAKQGPTVAYNEYKEFLKKDTTALFLAAAMENFGLTDIKDTPENFIPDAILRGTEQDKRDWLHAKTSEVVNSFVMLDPFMKTTEEPCQDRFPCAHEGCGKNFMCEKAKKIHESRMHGMLSSVQPSAAITTMAQTKDHIKEHSEARLGFGFFLINMMDAIKEGDGERLFRLYKFALLYYKAYGHTQYAYSTFLMTLQVNYTLSPRMAHSVIWNRFWNTHGGKNNIPLDLHLEHLNNFLKSFLKGLGPNLNETSADRVSRSIGVLKEFMDNVDEELEVTAPSGLHRANTDISDIVTLVTIFQNADLFKCHPNREFMSFPKFKKNLLGKLKFKDLCHWMKSKLKDWRNVPI